MSAEKTLISKLKETAIRDVENFSGIPKRTIYNYLNGVPIPLARAEKIAHALGLECYIGPPRQAAGTEKTGGSLLSFQDAGDAAPGLKSARDRHIAEIVTALVDHYDQCNDYSRQNFIKEVKARWPTLFPAGGPPLARPPAPDNSKNRRRD